MKQLTIKKTLLSLVLLITFNAAQADLAADLRQLRGVISETANTSKELGGLVGGNETTAKSPVPTESVTAPSDINEGDILISKIANIKLLKDPSKKAERAASLTRSDEMIYTGVQENGFYSVATANKGEGWVEKILVKKR